MTAIKNYTSTIPATTSLARIENFLVQAGAKMITKDYSSADKSCIGLFFTFQVDLMPVNFKVTAQTEECYNVLLSTYKRITPEAKKRCRDQAARTAWKIISDWVEIQVTMINLKQAMPLQLFLPFAVNKNDGKTFYETMVEQKFSPLMIGD